ncbi:AaceriAEL206Cp [[Ashbya] aceris (nom. inval.)]|nr:AaceriAEL206Cp [[Ashbya] aceris (nom. inval.)]
MIIWRAARYCIRPTATPSAAGAARWYSDGAADVRGWLAQLQWSQIPKQLYRAQYARASGPGGQNVNKVSTKCTVTLEGFSKCAWFPAEVREQAVRRLRYYARAQDAVVVQCDQWRSRERNREECLRRLVRELKAVVHVAAAPDAAAEARHARLRAAADRQRLHGKRRQGERKRLRGRVEY